MEPFSRRSELRVIPVLGAATPRYIGLSRGSSHLVRIFPKVCQYPSAEFTPG